MLGELEKNLERMAEVQRKLAIKILTVPHEYASHYIKNVLDDTLYYVGSKEDGETMVQALSDYHGYIDLRKVD